MILLGLDTATNATAVALRLSSGELREARDDARAGEHPGHATRLLAMARELLDEAGIGWSSIERIAVGAGPGTFTGLRVGVASARGLAQSLDVELLAVPSLRALALPAIATLSGSDEAVATIDARRGEVFVAAFDASGAPVTQAVALAPRDLGEWLAAREARRRLAIGDGAVRYRELLREAGLDVPEQSSPLHLLRAGAICELAGEQAASSESYQRVLPDYGRRPDAELALDGAASGQTAGS